MSEDEMNETEEADEKKDKSADENQKEVDLVREVMERLKIASDAEQDNREAHIEDTKFENGEQWDDETRRDREAHGRPALVFNKVAGTTKQIIGEMRQNKISIKVRPVDDEADPKTAEILTGLIRNIENVSNAESAYSCAAGCAIRGNVGYFRITTDYSHDDTFDQDIYIKRIVNPHSVYLDPAAVEADRSDARWCVISQTMAKKDFEREYPKKNASTGLDLGDGDDYADWFTEDAVRIAEYFQVSYEDKKLLLLEDGRTVIADEIADEEDMLEQTEATLRESGAIIKERVVPMRKITWYKVSGAEILEGPTEWAGKYIPIIPVLGEEVYVEGKMYLRSAIKWAKEPAKAYNWSRSNMIETLALAPKQPYIGTKEMFEGHEAQWDRANTVPQSRLVVNETAMGFPQRMPASINDNGSMAEAQISSDDIKAVTGRYEATLGAPSSETSGVAIGRKQAQGQTATFEFTDNKSIAVAYCGKVLVDLIPKIYDTERVVRLLGVDGKEGMAKINFQDPMSGEGVKLNDITIGKYDTVVTTTPAFATHRAEAAEGMFQVMQSAPHVTPVLLPRVVKHLDWPEADEIADELQAMNQPQQPGPEQQMEMQAQQIDMQGKQLDIQGKELDNQKTKIEMAAKIADTKEGQAETTIQVLKELGMIPDEK